ncbi:MAG TPA: hypothetical protein VK524_31670 [Polyangiaceae bacterium]|nr:hypothetical protein [Polyangiaceae bacterium]
MTDACVEGEGMPGTGCSRSGAQGACTYSRSQGYMRNVYYQMEADELETAKQLCPQGTTPGVWSDTP